MEMAVWKPHQLDNLLFLSFCVFFYCTREVQTRRFNFVWNLFSSLVVMHFGSFAKDLCICLSVSVRVLESLCMCIVHVLYMCSGCRKNLIKVQVVAHCSGMTYVHVWIWIQVRVRVWVATGKIDITLNNVVHKLNDSATKYGVCMCWAGWRRGVCVCVCAGRNLRIWPEGLSMCIRSFRKTQDTHCMWNINKVAEATQDGDEQERAGEQRRKRTLESEHKIPRTKWFSVFCPNQH